MISLESSGSFENSDRFFEKMRRREIFRALDRLAQDGVAALASATPADTGITASSWDYAIRRDGKSYTIFWTNDSQNKGFPIAIALQYGHGTGTGGYVQGRDYINPSIRPIFDQIAESVWKEVTSA